MKQRDKQFQYGMANERDSPEMKRSDSHPGLPPVVPVRQYENNDFDNRAKPSPIVSRVSNKPKPNPKPKSVRRPAGDEHSTSSNPAPAHQGHKADASHINMLIGANKQAIKDVGNDADNTYDVMGRDEPQEDAAQYSAVYTQKTAPDYTMGDNTYDEVHM